MTNLDKLRTDAQSLLEDYRAELAAGGEPQYPKGAADVISLCDEVERLRGVVVSGGMTLRDYFAAKAMQAILPTINQFPDEQWRVGVAIDAYLMADAMLAGQEKKS